MSQTWLPGAERQQGPAWKQGYFNIPNRRMVDIEGEVNHSAEGPWAALLAEIQNPTRQASWTFSIKEDGYIVQHYPFESITWHCGRKGDLDPDTEITGNVALVGKEHAGRKGTPITGAQEDASVYITKFVRQHSFAGNFPPELAVNLWEHNWINPNTSCPSDRVMWPSYLNKLEEEGMSSAEYKELKAEIAELRKQNRDFIRFEGENAVFEVVGAFLFGFHGLASFDAGEDWSQVRVIKEGSPEEAVYRKFPTFYGQVQ